MSNTWKVLGRCPKCSGPVVPADDDEAKCYDCGKRFYPSVPDARKGPDYNKQCYYCRQPMGDIAGRICHSCKEYHKRFSNQSKEKLLDR